MVVLSTDSVSQQHVLIHVTGFEPTDRAETFAEGNVSSILIVNGSATVLAEAQEDLVLQPDKITARSRKFRPVEVPKSILVSVALRQGDPALLQAKAMIHHDA